MAMSEREREAAREKAELEQKSQAAFDTLSSMWYGLFRQLVDKGFSEAQALELLKTYVAASVGKPS